MTKIMVDSERVQNNSLFYGVELPFIKFVQSQTWRMSQLVGKASARRSYDYEAVVNRGKPAPEVSIIIPVFGRRSHLEQSTKCLLEQVSRIGAEGAVNIVVSEMSSQPEHMHYCSAVGVDYVHLPANYFNKSLAMNIAASACPAENFIFYDVDLVTGKNWLERCLATINQLKQGGDNCYVVQPIEKRKISYVSDELTGEIFSGSKNLEVLKSEKHFIQPEWYKGNYPPGGIVLVSANLFYAVQGYDSSLYWGYSPEDKFFLERCIQYSTSGELMSWNTIASADTTTYHLFHDNSENTNISYEHMVVVADVMKNVPSLYRWYAEDKLRWSQVNRTAWSQILPNPDQRFPKVGTIAGELQKLWNSSSDSDQFKVEADKLFLENYSFMKESNPALHKIHSDYVDYIKSRVPDFFDIFINK